MKRMKILSILVPLLLIVMCAAFITGCGGNSPSDDPPPPDGIFMTVVTTAGGDYCGFTLLGHNGVSINWGDGTSPQTPDLSEGGANISHTYAAPGTYTITIGNYDKVVSVSLHVGDFTGLTAKKAPLLMQLYGYSSALTSLTATENPALKDLSCFDNELTSLTVSKNPLLEELSCGHNQLTSLTVSECPLLWDVDCSRNQLSSLDISGLPRLTQLNCSENQLSKAALVEIFRDLPDWSTNSSRSGEIDFADNPNLTDSPELPDLSDAEHAIYEDKDWLYTGYPQY